MPTYQYACTNPECGERFELVQSFTDPAASECPVCDGPVRKVFSAVGVVFKGSGFYRTDSRAAASSSASSGSASGSSDSSSSESKVSAGSSKAPSAASSSTSSSSPASSPTSGGGASSKAAAPA